MSFTLMAKASVIKTGNSGRKLVLMMLADSSSDEGNCFPSYRHIADVCEMSRRSVITHISKLEEMGLLQISHRKNTGKTEKAYWNSSNIYRLTLDPVIPLVLESGENSALPSESPALGSENSALGGSEMVAPRTYNPSYPINEPKINIDFEYLTADEFSELTEIRIANYKSQKKKAPAMSQRIATTLIKQISLAVKNNYSINDVLDEFSTRGWLTIKAEWMPQPSSGVKSSILTHSTGYNEKQLKNQSVTAAVLDVSNTNW